LETFITQAESEAWSGEAAHRWIEEICAKQEVNMGKLAQPIRVLIAGVPVSPPIDVTLELLGKDETLARLTAGIEVLKA